VVTGSFEAQGRIMVFASVGHLSFLLCTIFDLGLTSQFP